MTTQGQDVDVDVDPDLVLWLKANKFVKTLPMELLEENGCESLEDLQELDTKEDIESMAVDLGLKTIKRKKFIKAVMKLNNIGAAAPQPGSTPQSQKIPETEGCVNNPTHNHRGHTNGEYKESSPQAPRQQAKPSKSRQLNLKGLHTVKTLKRLQVGKKNRTIMVIGATGTGKTTMLNSMMNFLWQVEYSYPYRFRLIVEKPKQGGQAISQTDNVEKYLLDPPALPYQLTLIDTPGYGDTRGLAQDQKITKKIKKFFETQVQEIDAICFVIRAPQARLTPTQKYIFAQVLGIFGNDIAKNILILMTFADGKKPPALAALKAGNVPFADSFKLNNSAFDLPDVGEHDKFSEMFWQMGVEAFSDLFKKISQLKPRSLMLTKQVLTRREQLENYVTSVQPMIRNGFTVLDSIRQQIVALDKFGHLMNENKDFEWQDEIPDAKEIPNGGAFNTTTCLTCNFTCHSHCAYSDAADKKKCCAISGNDCTVCPSKCHWTLHKNLPYTVEWTTKKVTKTSAGLKAKYYDASSKKSAEEQVMAGSLNELDKVQLKLNQLITNVRNCINELSKIALRPNVMSQDDYIDKLIASEEQERKKGYQNRIAALKTLKKKQAILAEVTNASYDPFKQYQDVQQYVAKNKNINSKRKKKSSKMSLFGYNIGW